MKTIKNACKSKTIKNVKTIKGQPGAPKKAVKYPRSNFTVAEAIKFNKDVACGLTIRNRITEDVAAKLLVENGNRPQPNGKVGRPSTLYILAAVAATRKTKQTTKTPIKAKKVTNGETVKLAPVTVVTVTKAADVGVVAEVSPVEKNIPTVVPVALP